MIGRIVGDIVGTISTIIVLGLITWVVAGFMPIQYNPEKEKTQP